MANPKKSGKDPFGKFKRKHRPKAEKKNDRRKERMQQAEYAAEQAANLEAPMRLNRFIALAGICARREADKLIAAGKVRVNGTVVKELGTKVVPGKDKVVYNRRELRIKRFEYLLMNKPKGLITTVKDERGRSTVMRVVQNYTRARLFPVGRLDRNTTGLLLFTNDGELAEKLTHPKSEVPKLYHVHLNMDVDPSHIAQLRKGIELEDGPIKADKISYIEEDVRNEIGVRIHSGRNRIVRRMFEHLGYKVEALDRIGFGPLTKKKLPRSKCRFLTEKEVGFLKML